MHTCMYIITCIHIYNAHICKCMWVTHTRTHTHTHTHTHTKTTAMYNYIIYVRVFIWSNATLHNNLTLSGSESQAISSSPLKSPSSMLISYWLAGPRSPVTNWLGSVAIIIVRYYPISNKVACPLFQYNVTHVPYQQWHSQC